MVSRDHVSGMADHTCTDNDTGGDTWTRAAYTADKRHCFYWKRATSATASKTITVAGTSGSAAAGVIAYSGALASGTPYDNLTQEANASGNETHAPALTGLNDNDRILIMIANYSNDNAVTNVVDAINTAFTQRFEKLSTGGSDCGMCAWDIAHESDPGWRDFSSINWTQTNGLTYSTVLRVLPEPPAGSNLSAINGVAISGLVNVNGQLLSGLSHINGVAK